MAGVIGILFASLALGSCFELDVHRQHVGCFKDDPSFRDLPREITEEKAKGDLTACVKACGKLYYRYAGVQNGDKCFCGSSRGRYGPGVCRVQCTKDRKSNCGGEDANAVYETGILVPGPPMNVTLTSSTPTSISLSWSSPEGASEDFVTEYNVMATVNDTFDNRMYPPREVSVSGMSTTMIGLQSGTQYNISVSASSKDGHGPITSKFFWTEIGEPPVPEVPELIHHKDDGHYTDVGELHIRFKPLDKNPRGPITSYRIVVINETEPAPFHPESLSNWTEAQSQDLHYWIAAEFDPTWFEYHDEFVVGDGKTYGGYLNYGPLPSHHDFHVTVGVVSTWRNVTKVKYASVSHDQHFHENIVIFKFHDHSKDHDDHDHDHHHDDHDHHEEQSQSSSHSSAQILSTGLTVAVVIVTLLVIGLTAFFVYLRYFRGRKTRSNTDTQELTRTSSIVLDAESQQSTEIDSTDAVPDPLSILRSQMWQIPRNFIDLSHEIIGRGRFGSVIRGRVSRRDGSVEATIVQIVPGKLLSMADLRAMVRDVELVIRCGQHPNLLQLIGMCEEEDAAVFVAMEEGLMTMKQALLDSRALLHYPSFAEKNQKVSTMSEGAIMEYLLGVARGMEHLASMKIHHRKLCARNVFIVNNVAKIGGLGILDYAKPGQEVDLLRWTAQEAIKSKIYVTKCDVWAFACFMWEVVTLGATPYAEVSTRDVSTRVSRGLRLPMVTGMSEQIYQLMLECWQIDLDERPTFTAISEAIEELLAQGGNAHLDFTFRPGFEYSPFSNDLEMLQ